MSNAFVAGFLAGQLSLCVLVATLIWYFCLRAPMHREITIAPSAQATEHLRAVPLAQPAHDPAPETCNWLNAILQRVYLELHHNGLKQYVLQLVVDAFNSGKFPGFVGQTTVTELRFGASLPLIKYASYGAGPSEDNYETMDIVLDVCYADDQGLQVGLDTELIVNYPVAELASLPISFTVMLAHFSGRVRVRCPSEPHGTVAISLDSAPKVGCRIGTTMGAAAQLVDPPKLAQVITYQIEQAIEQYLVDPACIEIPLPVDLFGMPGTYESTARPSTPLRRRAKFN